MADYNSTYTGVQIDANLALAATAVQDADLATVATSGAYTDLSGRPTLGTAAATASTDYATAAQGALADTAVQPADDAADLGSGAATDGYVLTADGAGGAAWEAAAGGGGTPGGTDTQVQFNDGGAFGGDSGFTFDKTNNTLNVTGATITASDPIIDMAQTWNNAAVAFTAVKANVTDTASAAGSLLMDLQVGGTSRTRVDKNGSLRLSLSTGLGTIPMVETGGYGLYYVPANVAIALTSGDIQLAEFWRNTEPKVRFNSSISIGGSADTILARDAANTLAQRNGVNAQAFNLYNTYTDASNYERGFMRFVSNVLEIGAEAAGTGTARNLVLQRVSQIRASGDPDQYINMASAGYFSFFDNTGAEAVRYGVSLSVKSAWSVDWSSTTSPGAAKDVGINRAAAGQLKITNGSTGTGQLIFIVPTTDPGITGALWNNAGTLAISA